MKFCWGFDLDEFEGLSRPARSKRSIVRREEEVMMSIFWSKLNGFGGRLSMITISGCAGSRSTSVG